jgi:glycosyltransferase involved in cell wall biosynthesis
MSRLRVMHVVVGGDIGGAERLLTQLACRSEQTGAIHQAAVITPNRALADYLISCGVRIHDRGAARDNPFAYLYRSLGPADVAWLAALLVAERIDLVHTHTFASHVLGTRAARRAGLPQVRTEHHVMHYFDPSCSPFTRWAAARTERFIAVSRYVHSVLARTAPRAAARTTVVRNGVDPLYWVPGPASDGALRVGIVCRLTAWKRVHLAIEAAALAEVDLVVVGEGEERRRLEALARARGASVTFVGRHADPRPFVAQCDAILNTSDDEPLGLSVLEALAMERPVIAFAGGGIPEIVQPGVTGWLVSEATAEAFAGAILRARADRAGLRAMGVEGRRFVVAHCDLGRMCEGYRAVYQSVSKAS